MASTWRLVAAALLVAGLLAGCGSSTGKGTTSSAATTTSSAASSASASSEPPGLSGVKGRVLTAGELVGFKPTGNRTLGISAESWVHEDGTPESQRASEVKRLTGLGFIAAIAEHLQPTKGGNAEGLSVVEQFHSSDAAQTELAYQVKQNLGAGVTTFAVPGISGAKGFGSSRSETSAVNVAFSKGPYYYIVGAGWPTGAAAAPTRAELIAAAQHLYDRV